MSEIKQWTTKKMRLDKLTPADYNPREIKTKNLTGLERSIERFGMLEPIVWNKRSGNIVGGHQRFKVLLAKGVEETDIVVVDLPPNEEVAANIALNNPNIQGGWGGNIEDLLNDIRTDMPEVFSDLLMDDLASDLGFKFDEDDNDNDDDAAPALPKVPKSKYGEVYQLGAHRLMCGDSTIAKDVQKLMNGKLANIVVTDPPYNVDYTGKTKEALKIDNDSMDEVAFLAFLVDSFTCMVNSMHPGAAFYIWHAGLEGYAFRGGCRKAGLQVRQVLIWVKSVFVMGRQDYQWKHEPCLYGWKDGGSHLWATDRKQTTCIEVAKPSRNKEHPTMKPVELFEYQTRNSSNEGDILLDPFGGSGTSIIVAEKSKRVCYSMELDPHYVDVIRQRWAEYVHEKGCDWEELTPVAEDE